MRNVDPVCAVLGRVRRLRQRVGGRERACLLRGVRVPRQAPQDHRRRQGGGKFTIIFFPELGIFGIFGFE